MRNNKGFATSFILFSILVLFLILLSVLLFTLNNSSSLNGKLKNDLVNKIEDVEAYRQYNYSTAQFVQEFVAPKERNYTIKAWSANGNYIFGNIDLKKGEKLYLYVGLDNGKTDIRTIYGDITDTNSINSRILYIDNVDNDVSTSTTSNKLTNVVKKIAHDTNGNEKRPQNEDGSFIKIYYTINADKLEYNDKKYNSGCTNVQCVLDKIKQKISSD